MRSGPFGLETSILIVLKPGELIESVPYNSVLKTVKFPSPSVAVRTEVPFASNSTDAFGIAAPLASETTPEIRCCCAKVGMAANRIQHSAMVQLCCFLVHERTGPIRFIIARMKDHEEMDLHTFCM